MQKTRALAWADDSVGKVLASQAQESELEPRNSRKNLAGSHLYAQHWGETKMGRAMGPVSPAKPEALDSVENPVSENQGGELPGTASAHTTTWTRTHAHAHTHPKENGAQHLVMEPGYLATPISLPSPPQSGMSMPASESGTMGHRWIHSL